MDKIEKPKKTPMVPFSVEFGEYLKQKRIDAKLTQADVSNYLGYTSPQMVSKWERGICGPRFTDLIKLTLIFKLDECELMERMLQEQEKIFCYYLCCEKKRLEEEAAATEEIQKKNN